MKEAIMEMLKDPLFWKIWISTIVFSAVMIFLLRPKRKQIFVFGSNLAGHHMGGSAREAHLNHGAVWGVGLGPTGNAYAIPTLDEKLDKLRLDQIEMCVQFFLKFAANMQKYADFNVVAIGCGIAGFTPEQIAPMFRNRTPNVKLPQEFLDVLAKPIEAKSVRLPTQATELPAQQSSRRVQSVKGTHTRNTRRHPRG